MSLLIQCTPMFATFVTLLGGVNLGLIIVLYGIVTKVKTEIAINKEMATLYNTEILYFLKEIYSIRLGIEPK